MQGNLHRYFDPSTGRYISSDPIGQLGGANLYTYSGGDPVNRFDPFGLQSFGLEAFVMGMSQSGPAYAAAMSEGTTYAAAAAGSTGDFVGNYRSMREANTIGADKYFHCMANCQSRKRGRGGEDMSSAVSEGRELFDEYVKDDPRTQCDDDRRANDYGRGVPPGEPCQARCGGYRPSGLDPKY